jgi:flagellin-like protein
MKYRKFRKNMKAISPVISVLLMIAVAVVASLVVYAWVMGYIGFQSGKTGQAVQIQSMANATIGTSPGKLVVYLQNVGDGTVYVNSKSLFINGVQYDTNVTSSTPILAQSTLPILVPNYNLLNVPSQTLDVKVTTEGGTFSEVTKTFP